MSYGLGPVLDTSNFNIVLTVLGAFVAVLGLISYVVKERLYISDSLIAVAFGVAFGPLGANFIRPSSYGEVDEITLAFARLVIGIQLVLAGIQLPSRYIIKKWKSIAILLLPIMTFKWIVSALLIHLIFPLTYLEALCIGACITPTDPVLANAIVKGRYADKYVSEHLKNIISAEAGANDGFGYPFLFLAVYLLKEPSRGLATADWFVHIWLYEIAFSVVYGLIVGLLARWCLKEALKRKYVDNEAFLSYFLALSLFVIGTCGLIGTDDLLAAFIAGNAFSLGDFYREETTNDALQTSLDMLINLSIFVWVGATIPWTEMVNIDPGWRLLLLGITVLIFGRLPVMLALYKSISEIKTIKEAVFAGHFGPIGIGAIFYMEITLPYFESDPTYKVLHEHIKPIVYAMALSSIAVHGVTVPVVKVGGKASTALISMSRSISRWNTKSDAPEEYPIPDHFQPHARRYQSGLDAHSVPPTSAEVRASEIQLQLSGRSSGRSSGVRQV